MRSASAGSATMSNQFIAAELEVSRQEVQAAQEALIAFQVENRIGSLKGMINEQQELLRTLRLWRDEAWARGTPEQVEKFNQALIQREAELQDLVRLSAEYEALEADVQQAQGAYDFLLGKETEAKLTENEALAVGFIQVLGEATPPLRPISPYNFKILALGGIVSLGLAVVIAFLWDVIAPVTPSEEEEGREEPVVRTSAEA